MMIYGTVHKVDQMMNGSVLMQDMTVQPCRASPFSKYDDMTCLPRADQVVDDRRMESSWSKAKGDREYTKNPE